MTKRDFKMLVVIILVVVGLTIGIITLTPKNSTRHQYDLSQIELETEAVGYFKKDGLRYYTYNVQLIKGGIAQDTIVLTPGVLELFKSHGEERMHTDGNVTASFYYLNQDAPNISVLESGQLANDMSHASMPIVSVWIMPTGDINVFEKPQ